MSMATSLKHGLIDHHLPLQGFRAAQCPLLLDHAPLHCFIFKTECATPIIISNHRNNKGQMFISLEDQLTKINAYLRKR